ncbi:MAG TPA: aminotransferase class I/II-fold pyridoxal phosphate-dependent enzyme [Gemmatimonadales bacterium]
MAARFVPFALERWQSTWENRVHYNLSESGVHPLSIRELLALSGSSLDALAEQKLVYSQSNGTTEHRRAIASLYPGATADHVVASVGSAEANFIVCWTLIEKGDKVSVVTPTYMQTWGLSQNLGAKVTKVPLLAKRGWEPDLKTLKKSIPAKTKLVVLTNPNNPTGHAVSDQARAAIVARAAEVGAWLLLDEVYQGAERNGVTTRSLFGDYERAIAVNGLSKAYGLPGLRIGWVVAPPALSEKIWSRHDYTVIGPGPANDFLAQQALKVRDKIFARTRGILNANYPVLEAWLKQFGDLLEWQAPDAGAICWVKYRNKAKAEALVEKIRVSANVLLCAGEHFGLPGYLRLGFGNERKELDEGLAALAGEMKKLK